MAGLEGTLVGDAYVRIHADTSGMAKEIQRRAAKDGDDYAKAFEKQFKETASKQFEKDWQELADAAVKADFSKFEKQFGGVDEVIRHIHGELDAMVDDGQDLSEVFDDVTDALDQWAVPARLEEDLRKVAEEEDAAWREAKLLNNVIDDMAKSAERNAKAFDKMDTSAWRHDISDLTKSFDGLNKELDQTEIEARKVNAAWDKNRVKEITADYKSFRLMLRGSSDDRARDISLLKEHGHDIENIFDKLRAADRKAGDTSGLKKFEKTMGNIGTGIGKAFGKGSRNNFVNIVGSMIGGFTRLILTGGGVVSIINKIGDSISDVRADFDRFKATGSNTFNALIKSVGGFASEGLVGIVAGVALLGVVLQTVAFTAGIAAAAISMLAGTLVALGAAISFGIAGAVLALVPILASLAPVLLIVMGLMEDFSVAASKQPAYIAKIKAAWGKVSSAVTDAKKSILTAVADIAPILADFWNPLVQGTGKALTAIIKDFGAMLKDPAMKGFFDQWKVTLPRILQNVGLGINHLLGGLTAFFTPILPFAERLSKAFEGLMGTFQKWASSATGQNAISDFMDKAWDAASSLWDILTSLAGAIGKIFSAGEDTGQGFLDKIAALAQKFNEWLGTAEGQQAMKDFFRDVQDFARQAWEIVVQLWQLFDNLDTSDSRDNLNQVLTVVEGLLVVINKVVPALEAIFPTLRQVGINILNAMSTGVTAFQQFFNAVTLVFEGILQAAVLSMGWMPGIGPALREAAGKFDKFRDDTNSALTGINKVITITANTLAAQDSVTDLQRSVDKLNDKTITVGVHYTTSGVRPGGGRGTGGGSTADAAGAIHFGPTNALIGEAGPEAVVPLRRPLSLVDPAVRALSAFAQGLPFAGGGIAGGGRSITVAEGAIQVNTTSADPQHVAMSVLDRLTAQAI